MANIMFHVGSQADYHLFKNVASDLAFRRHHVALAVPDGELLPTLPPIPHAPVVVVGAARSGDAEEVVQTLRQQVRFLTVIRLQRPHLLVGSSPDVAAISRLMGIPCLVVSDRDAGLDPAGCASAHQGAQVVVSPDFCAPGQWARKTIQFSGFPSLAYLHPRRFVPSRTQLGSGSAHGLSDARQSMLVVGSQWDTQLCNVVRRLVATLSPRASTQVVSDTGQSDVSQDLAPHLLPAAVDVHGSMARASLVVSDDPRRVEEAAVLGTPAVWLTKDGHSAAVNQLVSRYGLSMCTAPVADGVASIARCVLDSADRGRRAFQARRQRLLVDAVDVTSFIAASIESTCETILASRTRRRPSLSSRTTSTQVTSQ